MSTRAWRNGHRGFPAAVACAALALATAHAVAQPAPFPQLEVARDLDSGPVTNPAGTRGAAFSTILTVPGAAWIRLTFDRVSLGAAPPGAQPTVLVLTSILDGATQHHGTLTLQQWGNTSAYFNGPSVRLEIIADPGALPSRVVISSLLAGYTAVGNNGICGLDDRLPSSDPRVCRGAPNGCSAFMISDYSNCFLTAGHCNLNFALVEFNVPLSNPDGTLNHPGPENQYVVDQSSILIANGGIGNDWCYFGVFPNTETGRTAYEAQGAAFDLAATPPPVSGQTIRATGYGVDATPPDWNQAQQTSTGSYVTFFGSTVQFRADAQAGSSGSPLVNESNGRAIGILTHGGCVNNAGANNGTGTNNAGLQSALANPLGVCLPAPPVDFVFPGGIPQSIDPGGVLIRVEVVGANGGTPQPGTGMLHYDAGGGPVAVPMVPVAPNVYDAVFPRLECFLPVLYYFSAQATTGESVNSPLLAPSVHYQSLVAWGLQDSNLLASAAASSDFFGISVAVGAGSEGGGEVAVAGAFGDADNGPGSGAAYLFGHDGATWVQDQKLLAPDGAPGDSFGYAVAVSGDIIVIGALGDADRGPGAGSAYVFRLKDYSTWMLEQKLLASDGAAGDAFGVSVAIDGNTVLIGAYADDDRGNSAGAAYVFRHDGASWVQQQKLLASDGAEGDSFGNAVALHGGAALIGAFSNDEVNTNAGAAYVFRQDGSAWVQEQKLLAGGGAESDFFGYAVAIEGAVALVGARGDDDNGSNSGSVHEFIHGGSDWTQGQTLLPSDGAPGDGFGGAVALSTGAAVIGASTAGHHGTGSGAAYVFRHNGSTWIQAQELALPQGAPGDAFGISVAALGGIAMAGAWRDDAGAIDSGSAELFETLCISCPYDLDGDNTVGVRDFLSLLSAWGTSPGGAPDFDGDGTVGQDDLEALLAAWGTCA